MPLFEYECQNCGEVFEELVFSSRVTDDEIKCPHCGLNRAKKLISAPALGNSSGGTSTGGHSCGTGGFS
ncbi:MAG: zinc ribbon domain-containing protein [Candidatus Neomarinimicrobiota bacterium]